MNETVPGAENARTLSPEQFVHRHREAIRWGDMDAFGHVNNVQFFRYLESARVEYALAVLSEQVRPEGENIILADIRCAFRRQLRWPGEIDIYTRAVRIGRTSIGLQQILCLADTDTLVATSDTVLVWFDFKAQRSAQVPDAIRSRIGRYEKTRPQGL